MKLLTEAPHLDDLLAAAGYSDRISCLNCGSHIEYVDYCFEELVRRGLKTTFQIRELAHDFYNRITKGKNVPLPCPHCRKFNLFNTRQGIVRVAKPTDAIVRHFVPDLGTLFMVDETQMLSNFHLWLDYLLSPN